jgi:dihydrofolate synthase/folylpolyglutamate synthase
MNYKHTLNYLYEQLPMFHRIGAAAYKADLTNTHKLMELLNHPHHTFKTIHIAGTNGKGSTSHMLASVLQHAGYKVGLYTSPHLKDFRERIRVNGKMIARKYVCEFVANYKTDCDKIQLSFFEWTVGLAFDYFRTQKVDVAIIETGLGGRLDSTNVITPLLSIITNIGFDHMNLLGNTLPKIAIEKAGIIKHHVPVVIGETSTKTDSVFIKKAKSENASIYFAANEYQAVIKKNFKTADAFLTIDIIKYDVIEYKNLKLDLTGSYQLKNVVTIIKIIDLLQKHFIISKKAIYSGLQSVKETTGLMGRWQVLKQKPLVICDTGHNEDGINEVLKNIGLTKYNKLHFVLGMVNDKDIATILKMLPKDATYYFCKANLPRGLDAQLLSEQAARKKLFGKSYKSVKQAMKAAIKQATANDLVFIGGSTFTVAEVV